MPDLKADDRYWVKITLRRHEFLRCDFTHFALVIRWVNGSAQPEVVGLKNGLLEYGQFLLEASHKQCQVTCQEIALREFKEAVMIANHYRQHKLIQEPRFFRFFCQTFPWLITI
ncbi:MAG: hypothetical protein EXS52_01870 [Candidatus Staskawiczbacteria bacterium]|nr:hypothetical protein [Candidatus Staskawiczbacteria bacterium]